MKNIAWLIAGLTATIAYLLVNKSKAPAQPVPISDLAHKLQDAWADHHTVV